MDMLQIILMQVSLWIERMRRIMAFIRESFLPGESFNGSDNGFPGI